MRFPRYLLLCAFYLLIVYGAASARRGDDSVQIIETPAGTYVCCYDILVMNRTPGGTKISEIRFKIVSGNGRIVTGETDAPFMWTSQQDSAQVAWFSTGAAYDIGYGQTTGGFHICPRDTGIVRFVWETRNVDSLISSDTVALACRGVACDQAFFRPVPSDVGAVFDIDLVAGNTQRDPINGFHVRRLTPGATFKSGPVPGVAGWTRSKAGPDTVSWTTLNSPLTVPKFIESFRFELNASPDSNVQIEYWTTAYGDIICRDTAIVQWGLSRRDSVRATRLSDTCCDDIQVRNLHTPSSQIDLFTIKVTTPGVAIEGFDVAPPAWRQLGPFGSGDSIAFLAAAPLRPLDSATFSALCFNNMNASSDTIHWKWRLWTRGAVIDEGDDRNICLRPLTACDSLALRVDSTYPAPERCVYVFMKNGNSRNTAISRLALTFSNPGTARRVRSAAPPPGWEVESFGRDSALFVGNPLSAGDTISPFVICLSNGDTSTGDPLSVRWTTANGLGPICRGVMQTNANINADCDAIEWTEIPSDDTTICCFRGRVLNRNGRNHDIDRLSMVVDLPVIFASASADSPWSAVGTVFPSFDVSFFGDVVAPDSASPEFTICLDMRQIPERPATIPVAWTTMFGRSLVCADTVRVICRGQVSQACDDATLADVVQDGCASRISIRNRHEPAGPVDGIDIRIPSNCSLLNVTSDGTFSQITFDDTLARLRDGSVAPGGTTTVQLDFDDICGTNIPVRVTTLNGSVPLCTDSLLAVCTTSEVRLEPNGDLANLSLLPNPARGTVRLSFTLSRPRVVGIVIRDADGRTVKKVSAGSLQTGVETLDLDMEGMPSGLYFVIVQAGNETLMRPLILKR